ncbi:hypothetical protein ACF0H5_017389 [Mactra antiquata]
MPANTAQTGRRSVCQEDALDESQLEAELCRLQRQLHVMEGNRRTYSEEACNLLRKQQAEIIALKNENEEINKILRLAKSDRNQGEDSRDIDKLLGLIDKLDEYKRLCAEEERQVKDLDEEILRTQEMINEERKLVGSATEEKLEMSIKKRLRVTENRLDQELIKFNNQLAENARLREELDHLRQEKSVFDTIHKKLTKQLEDTKQRISDSITQAAHAYEERDEAQNKMLALKERSDKDKNQQEIEMKELLRIIKHDNKLKQFMGIKVQDRADLKEEELVKKQKGKDSVDKDQDNEKQSIKLLEAAFDKITEATGEKDINKIVNDFIKKEEQNFALYNYVNELNDTVESIQEEINGMQSEIDVFMEDDVKNESSRRKMIKEMEVKAENFGKEVEEADKKNVKVCKVLDEIRGGVTKLFKDANCDSSTINDMLGSEEGVTNKNILQYMGLIEQRTMELVRLQQYINMKKEPPKQERKDSKSLPTPPVTQQTKKSSPRHTHVAIVPPLSMDDEDMADDGELRPLTRNEIKSFVMKSIGSKVISADLSQRSANKRLKAKSPN